MRRAASCNSRSRCQRLKPTVDERRGARSRVRQELCSELSVVRTLLDKTYANQLKAASDQKNQCDPIWSAEQSRPETHGRLSDLDLVDDGEAHLDVLLRIRRQPAW